MLFHRQTHEWTNCGVKTGEARRETSEYDEVNETSDSAFSISLPKT